MDFLLRHPVFAMTHPRKAWKTRKAMKEYARLHPVCEWDKKTTPVEVHHIIPISEAPELAADPDNFISLGARRNHFVVGHACNWKHHVVNVRELCDSIEIDDDTGEVAQLVEQVAREGFPSPPLAYGR